MRPRQMPRNFSPAWIAPREGLCASMRPRPMPRNFKNLRVSKRNLWNCFNEAAADDAEFCILLNFSFRRRFCFNEAAADAAEVFLRPRKQGRRAPCFNQAAAAAADFWGLTTTRRTSAITLQ